MTDVGSIVTALAVAVALVAVLFWRVPAQKAAYRALLNARADVRAGRRPDVTKIWTKGRLLKMAVEFALIAAGLGYVAWQTGSVVIVSFSVVAGAIAILYVALLIGVATRVNRRG